RAEQWRKDGACGPAAVVAIALLNELERVRINVSAYRNFTADMLVSQVEINQDRGTVTLHKTRAVPERGRIYKFAKWPDYMGPEHELVNMFRLVELFTERKGAGLFGNGRTICVELDDLLQVHLPPSTLAQANSKANDDMLAAQRNLLLREDGYPNAPTSNPDD
ncbi:hypothetical protein, partial [Glaesserella parasuis]|uniref:hypothetical protein n=1 Tax=Glaesserella parasuis TaxID=738 RepID=UPI003F2A221E